MAPMVLRAQVGVLVGPVLEIRSFAGDSGAAENSWGHLTLAQRRHVTARTRTTKRSSPPLSSPLHDEPEGTAATPQP
jgi:hypothetical protein